MKPQDYIFNVGDEVITVDGIKGTITHICYCERCQERGFYEPVWEDDDLDDHYISNYEADFGFHNYYKIGQYRFAPFCKDIVESKIEKHESALTQLRRQLSLIEELEKEE